MSEAVSGVLTGLVSLPCVRLALAERMSRGGVSQNRWGAIFP
jgi:hypothetical protein